MEDYHTYGVHAFHKELDHYRKPMHVDEHISRLEGEEYYEVPVHIHQM